MKLIPGEALNQNSPLVVNTTNVSIFEEISRDDYKRAFEIACDLLNEGSLYGIDTDNLFALIMQKYGVVSAIEYQKFILNHLDRFSDDDEIRLKAIEKLGW
jgi:hypothetical protein